MPFPVDSGTTFGLTVDLTADPTDSVIGLRPSFVVLMLGVVTNCVALVTSAFPSPAGVARESDSDVLFVKTAGLKTSFLLAVSGGNVVLPFLSFELILS